MLKDDRSLLVKSRGTKLAACGANVACNRFQCDPCVVGKKHVNFINQNDCLHFINNQGLIIKMLAYQKEN